MRKTLGFAAAIMLLGLLLVDERSQLPVWLINPTTGEQLQINGSDGGQPASYSGGPIGLWDIPGREALISEGYQSGPVLVGTRAQPRQFSLLVYVEAGSDQAQVLNPEHNVARDRLLSFLPEDGQVILRSPYPGTSTYQGLSEYWDIRCAIMGAPRQQDSAAYLVSLFAANPCLTNAVTQRQDFTLDATHLEITRQFTGGGNTLTRPVVYITPTGSGGKAGYWRWRRHYTVTNNANVQLTDYPVRLPFDWAWHHSNGRILSVADFDVHVVQDGNRAAPSFKGAENNVDTDLWVLLNLPPLATVDVDVLYGNAAATYEDPGPQPAFTTRTAGPTASTNSVWRYDQRFGSSVGGSISFNFRRAWTPHYAPRSGFEPILRTLGGIPWTGALSPLINAAGGEMRNPGKVNGYAGVALHHPLGFTQVVHHGYTHVDPALAKFVLRTRDLDGVLTDVWETPGHDTTALIEDYAGGSGSVITNTLSTPAEAVVFALRSLTTHDLPAGAIGGADKVLLSINSPPTVTGSGSATSNEFEVYYLALQIENLTTGEQISLNGGIRRQGSGAWNRVVVDLDDLSGRQVPRITQQAPDGAGGWTDLYSFYYALALRSPITDGWLKLLSIVNRLRVSDEQPNGLAVRVEWVPRRL